MSGSQKSSGFQETQGRTGSRTRNGEDGPRPWIKPTVEELPPLRNLTLATGSGIGGDESVFPS